MGRSAQHPKVWAQSGPLEVTYCPVKPVKPRIGNKWRERSQPASVPLVSSRQDKEHYCLPLVGYEWRTTDNSRPLPRLLVWAVDGSKSDESVAGLGVPSLTSGPGCACFTGFAS